MLEQEKITIIGPGVMGKAILANLIQSGVYPAERISISGPRFEEITALSESFGVSGFTQNSEAIAGSKIIILAVKPQRFTKVAESIAGIAKQETMFISIIAGVDTTLLTQKLDSRRIVRAMTNTAAQIGQGMTVWFNTADVDENQHITAQKIFQSMGDELFVEDENYLDMATALSGTGPAYIYIFMEALIDSGVHMGFPRRIAEKLVVKTIEGSLKYYQGFNKHPAEMRNEVTSPGGTSAEALYYLEKAGFRTAISRAVWAAFERSKELGAGLNRKVEK